MFRIMKMRHKKPGQVIGLESKAAVGDERYVDQGKQTDAT